MAAPRMGLKALISLDSRSSEIMLENAAEKAMPMSMKFSTGRGITT